MTRKDLILILTVFFFMASVAGCGKTYAPEEEEDEQEVNEDQDDYTGTDSDTVFIVLSGTSITATYDVVSISGSKATITRAGTYSVSGTLTNGQLIVNTTDEGDVRLILNDVNITCSSSAPINIRDSEKTIIVLADNTTNYLTDGSSYTYDDATEEEPNAAVFSKSDLTIFGTGALNVKANFNDGISGKDGVIIKGGSISVNAVDDGIRGKDYLIIREGDFTINAGGKGMKSDNDNDTSVGYIQIDTGHFIITSGSDAVAAASTVTITYAEMTLTAGGGSGTSSTTSGYTGSVSAKGIKAASGIEINGGIFGINSADDGIHTEAGALLNEAEINISTMDDAVHAEGSLTFNSGSLSVTKCYEGFESQSIAVTGGYVNIASTDDAFNATKGAGTEANDGSLLSITGGTIAVNATKGDGLDSNGSISMSGGTVIVHGPSSQPEVAFDYNGTFNISGGLLVGVGPNSGSMIQATSATSSQYAVKITSSTAFSSSTLFHIQDASGNDILTFKPYRSAYYMIFSSPQLISNGTYTIYTGGSSTGTYSDGLYTGGSYTPGTLKKSFTISGKVTTVSF